MEVLGILPISFVTVPTWLFSVCSVVFTSSCFVKVRAASNSPVGLQHSSICVKKKKIFTLKTTIYTGRLCSFLQVTFQMALTLMCPLGLLCCQQFLQHCFLSDLNFLIIVVLAVVRSLVAVPQFFPTISEYMHLFVLVECKILFFSHQNESSNVENVPFYSLNPIFIFSYII